LILIDVDETFRDGPLTNRDAREWQIIHSCHHCNNCTSLTTEGEFDFVIREGDLGFQPVDNGWNSARGSAVTMRRDALRLATLVVVLAMPLIGIGGIASAKAAHRHHPGVHRPVQDEFNVTVSSNPSGEIGKSVEAAVIQVHANPSLAQLPITINASKLAASCRGNFSLDTVQAGTPDSLVTAAKEIDVALDNDGNVTVVASGENCAPGRRKIEAALDVEPFYTATTSLKVRSPIVRQPGLIGEPQTNGSTGEIETGDSESSGFSDVYALFYVETNAAYANQPAEVDFSQLAASCSGGWLVAPVTGKVSATNANIDPEITSNLDGNGNAAFLFVGARCTATTSNVTADVEAGTDPTYSTNLKVYPAAAAI
jgi:hypothetical protein